MPNRPRKQHYVTRAYLQNFVAEGEKTLYVYTRGKTSCFRAQPENVAAISNYYSHKNEDGTFDDRVEHMLEKVIESPGIKIIQRLNGGHYNISKDARLRLAALMAVQEYRTPWMREHMETFTTKMLQNFTKSMLAAPGLVEATLVKKRTRKRRRDLHQG